MAGSFAAGAAVGGIAIAATQPLPGPPAAEAIKTQVTETNPIITIGDIKALRAALERDGFIVQEGEFSHQDANALLNAGVTKYAAGANVGAPTWPTGFHLHRTIPHQILLPMTQAGRMPTLSR